MSRKRKPAQPVTITAIPESETLAEGSGPVAVERGVVEVDIDIHAIGIAARSDAGELEAMADDLERRLEVDEITEDVIEIEAAAEADGEVAEGDGEAAEPDLIVDPAAGVLPTSASALDAVQLKQLVEALVFAADKPITVLRLRQLTRVSDTKRLEQALAELTADYCERGLVLQQVSGGYQFRTRTQWSSWVQQLIAGRPVRLTRAQLETLAIIAYRQPITRPEIDQIRGVDSSATLKLLIDRTLIRILGKKEEVGRPMLYGTTREFLDFFSLGDLRELPTLREYSELTDESRQVMTDRLGIDPGGEGGEGGDGDSGGGGGSAPPAEGGESGGDGGGSLDLGAAEEVALEDVLGPEFRATAVAEPMAADVDVGDVDVNFADARAAHADPDNVDPFGTTAAGELTAVGLIAAETAAGSALDALDVDPFLSTAPTSGEVTAAEVIAAADLTQDSAAEPTTD